MRLAAALPISFLLVACGTVEAPPRPAAFTFVQLKTGSHTPATKEESQQVFGGHFANMQRLAREGSLLMAGPNGKTKSDPALRGVFVLATADRAMAKQWAESDPGFQAGVFRLEYAAMATTSDLRAQLAADLSREDSMKASGQPAKPGEGLRGYVLLTASNGEGAAQAFAASPGALMIGRLDDGRTLVLLDAKDFEAATAWVAPVRERLGTFTLDEWMATDLLDDLPKRSTK
jgi:uncharacterized protein YciI